MQKFKKILLLVISLCIVSGCANSNSEETKGKNILLKNETIKVEIADTQYLRERGLSYRTDLCKECGMLFLFKSYKNYAFWMKDMNFPLDIIYLKDNKVVEIFKSVPLTTGDKITQIYPQNEANMVLELNSGWSDSHNLEIGDNIDILD